MSETNNSGNRPQNNNNRNRQGGNNRNRNNNNKNNRNRNNNRNGNNNNRNAPKKLQPLTLMQKFLSIFGVKPKRKPQVQARPPVKAKTSSTAKPRTANPNQSGKKPDSAKKPRQPKKVEVTSGRLYVGNLSYETTEYDLEELFKGNGTVKSVELIYNRHTHKSKGYGFIEMLSPDDAKNAVNVHHDQPFMGRNLIVNGARERQEEENRESRETRAKEEKVAEVKATEATPAEVTAPSEEKSV